MPGFDGTGPMGAGPMTGGGRGMCNPGERPYAFGGRGFRQGFGAGFGPGFGRGRGYGRGYGRRWAYPPAGEPYGAAYEASYANPYVMKPEDEINVLRNEAGYIKEELDAIHKRIEELEAKSSA